MIILYVGIGKGDVQKFEMAFMQELLDYLKEFKKYDKVWLFSGKSPDSEIVITESIDTIRRSLFHNVWGDIDEYHIHEYSSYEDAYSVALGMREGSEKCYNSLI